MRLLDDRDSRGDIISTAKHLCSKVKEGKLDVSGITVDEFGQHLSSSQGFPEVDLVLKFGIVDSLFGFLPWHIRVAEMM